MMRLVAMGLAGVGLLFGSDAWASEPLRGDAPPVEAPPAAVEAQAARSLQGLIEYAGATALRNDRMPSLARQLRALGRDGLRPMLDVLQPGAPALASLRAAHPERAARLEALILDAVGRLEDPAAAPTLRAAVGRTEAEVAGAGARGLGKLCRAEDLTFLAAHAAPAAIEGLGFCRRPETGPALQRRLQDATTLEPAARAAGNWGSSWAWQALGEEAAAEARAARLAVATALVAALPGSEGESRAELIRALRMLDLPETAVLLQGIADRDPDAATLRPALPGR